MREAIEREVDRLGEAIFVVICWGAILGAVGGGIVALVRYAIVPLWRLIFG